MRLLIFFPALVLAACEMPLPEDAAVPAETPVEEVLAVAAPPPPVNATTVEQFDTTTAADRAAATNPATSTAAQALGTTIATLGPPAEPGIWLKTALVTDVTAGRVTYQGKSVNLELRPSGGVAGSGSQISLAAMRLIAAPLTSLPELTVFASR